MWCMLTVGGTGCGCFPHGAHSTFSGKVCKHAPATTTTTPPNTTPTTTTIAATTPTTTTGSASATPPTTVAGPLVEHEVRREQRIRDINRFLQSLSLGPLSSPPPPQAKPTCRQMESPPQLPTRATPQRHAKRRPRVEVFCYCHGGLPEDGDNHVQCDGCWQWVHWRCHDPPPTTAPIGAFLCKNCV